MKDWIAPYLGMLKGAAIIAVVLGIFYAGMRVNESKWLKKQADAVEKALDGERALQLDSNSRTLNYIANLQKQLEKAHALPKITLVNDCAVPAAIGRLLNDAQRMHPDAATRSDPEPAAPAVDSTCAAELEIAKRNYAEFCIPNAQQLTEVQERWEKTREFVNGK